MRIRFDDPAYPPALAELANPPPILTTSGPLRPRRAVAIVGARRCSDESRQFAYDLASKLAKAGVVIVSGGAIGVDEAAHRGALDGGGVTWVVSPTGCNRVYPREHAALFAKIAASEESRMIWCVPDEHDDEAFLYRNGVLVALSEAVVVIQATLKSGSRNAANWAISLRRPLWVVTAAPWMTAFSGSLFEIEDGRAQPLCSIPQLFRALGLPIPSHAPNQAPPLDKKHGRAPKSRMPLRGPSKAPARGSLTPQEELIFTNTSPSPQHIDQIAERAAVPAASAVTALLTLSLKDVVVEGPGGFFRRR